MASIRSFLSISASPQLRNRAASLIEDLQSIPSGVKWEHPEKLHLTLKFFGSVEESLLKDFGETLKPRVSGLESFTLTYSGLGAFPSLDHPRIFWIGAEPSDDLLRLVSVIEEVSTSFGLPSEERRFHAHITIGRVKGTRNLNRLTAMVKSVTLQPTVARCSEICIMKSVLHPTGSQYAVVQSIPLKS